MKLKTLVGTAAAVAGALTAGAAQAVDLSTGDVQMHLDSVLSAGFAVRVEDRDPMLIGIGNGGQAFSTNADDGDLAFDKGDFISSPFKLTSDFSASYGDFGLFARGSAFVNPVLDSVQYFDPADYGPGREFDDSERQRKERQVRDHVGANADLLDLYAYGSHTLFERQIAWRVGRQVINWGESTLVQNGINSILSADANRLRNPGFQIEEVIIPWNAVWGSIDLIENVSLEGYYQIDWQRTIPDAAGTYFSTQDFVSIGGTQANLGFGRLDENTGAVPPQFVVTGQGRRAPCATVAGGGDPTNGAPCTTTGSTVPRLADRTPSNQGQFGGALRIFAPWLNNGTDLGLYAAKFHSRLPLISGVSRSSLSSPADDAGYFIEYPEDIQLYGLGFSTSLPFGLAMQGEYSYKVDQPLQIDDVEVLLAGLGVPGQLNPVPGATLGNQYLRGWRRYDVSQADVSFTSIYGPWRWLRNDQLVLLAEAAVTHVHGLPSPDELRFEAPNTGLPGSASEAAAVNLRDGNRNLLVETNQYATATSWGYKLIARATYNNVFDILTLEPTLRFDHDVHGITPAPTTNFVEGRKQLTFSIAGDYINAWRGEIGYTRYFGGGDQNLLSDRDFVEASLKYFF